MYNNYNGNNIDRNYNINKNLYGYNRYLKYISYFLIYLLFKIASKDITSIIT